MRSNYSFKINCDSNKINEIIQNYLTSYNFVYKQEQTESYYIYENQMQGNRCFNYYIKDGILYITAWLKGGLKSNKDIELNQNRYDFATRDYLSQLSILFNEINKVNNIENINNNYNLDQSTEKPIQNDYAQINNNNNHSNQNFIDEVNKKNEKMCEWGFWLSILGFLLSLFGYTFGIAIYILNFYLASQGLKTRKRVKAISTIVLSGASIFLVIFQILLF